MWWDDEDRRTNAASAVGKGAIVKDALFLEAEKLGIDIRDSYITTAGVDPTKGAPVIKEETNTNQLDSGALFNSSQPGNSVLFNFFPDTSDSATSNKQILDAASADDSAMDIISTAQISMQPVTITELVKFAASFSRDK